MGRRPVQPSRSRTFALVGHRSAGKTSVAELLLAKAGVTRARGSVEDGTSLLDHQPQERARKMSLSPDVVWMSWRDTLLYMIDTPGTGATAYPAQLALWGVDTQVLVVAAPDGVEQGTERALARARRRDAPLLVVVDKMDREHQLESILADIERKVGRKTVLMQLPLHDHEGNFVGVIDVAEGHALRYASDGSGAFSVEPLPAADRARWEAAQERMFEAAALTDDDLLEAYLEYLHLSKEAVQTGITQALELCSAVPVYLLSATHAIGADPLLDALAMLGVRPDARRHTPMNGKDAAWVAQWIATRRDGDGKPYHLLRVRHGELPAHATAVNSRTHGKGRIRHLYKVRGPRRARADHTSAGAVLATWDPLPGRPGDVFTDGPGVVSDAPAPPPPMAWLCVRPMRSADLDRIEAELAFLTMVDPSLSWEPEPLHGGIKLAGHSGAQLSEVARRLRLVASVRVELPPVSYVETPNIEVDQVHGLHKRIQNGLVSEFGECWLSMQPRPPEDGFQFVPEVDEDVLPERFLPGISEGAQRALRCGPTAGYPVHGLVVRCTGGEYDVLESTEEHFQVAGERAMRSALEQAGTRLLEPWSKVDIHLDSGAEGRAEVGSVLADLASHRGRVVALEVAEDAALIQAECPDRELRTLGARLESLSSGRGWFTAASSHYDVLPAHLVGEAVASSPSRQILAARNARTRLDAK